MFPGPEETLGTLGDLATSNCFELEGRIVVQVPSSMGAAHFKSLVHVDAPDSTVLVAGTIDAAGLHPDEELVGTVNQDVSAKPDVTLTCGVQSSALVLEEE